MPIITINPGTEPSPSATLENAVAIVDRICADLTIPRSSVTRRPSGDVDGFFGFTIAAQPPFDIDVPGEDPAVFFLSRPFTSRRMYVDGSSWLWGFAIGAINRRLGRGDDQ